MDQPTKTPLNIKAIAIILAISIGSPVILHFLMKPKDVVAVQTVSAPIVQQTPQVVPIQIITQQVIQVVTQQIIQVVTQQITNTPVVNTTQDRFITELQNIVQSLTNKPPDPKAGVYWLASPVTQSWYWDTRKQTWKNESSYMESFKSPPNILLGLKADGTVVWRKIEQ